MKLIFIMILFALINGCTLIAQTIVITGKVSFNSCEGSLTMDFKITGD